MQPLDELIKKQCIGLTGGVATGKSTVASILREQGHTVFDADQMARAVVTPGRPAFNEIIGLFGQEVLSADGTIDRKKLGQVVFNAPEKRSALEAITHPRIREEFQTALQAALASIGAKPFFYEAALLFEAGRAQEFKCIVCTWCPESVQLERLMRRNHLSEAEARAILKSQMPAAEKRGLADIVIDTNCSREELRIQMGDIIRELEGVTR